MRFLAKCVLLYSVLFCHFIAPSYADVYFDSSVPLEGSTDALVGVLSDAVVPGGDRLVTLNGTKLAVRRFANPAGDDSEFYHTWKRAEAQKDKVNADILSITKAFDPLPGLMLGTFPNKPILDGDVRENLAVLVDESVKFAIRQSSALKDSVIKAIETPFTYETPRFRAIASVPIKALDPDSALAVDTSENGFLLLAEKSNGTTRSDAFWQIQFDEDFKFADLFGANDGDVAGEELSVQRYPGSTMTMVFSESANDWSSHSWSYESSGDVLSHIIPVSYTHLTLPTICSV